MEWLLPAGSGAQAAAVAGSRPLHERKLSVHQRQSSSNPSFLRDSVLHSQSQEGDLVFSLRPHPLSPSPDPHAPTHPIPCPETPAQPKPTPFSANIGATNGSKPPQIWHAQSGTAGRACATHHETLACLSTPAMPSAKGLGDQSRPSAPVCACYSSPGSIGSQPQTHWPTESANTQTQPNLKTERHPSSLSALLLSPPPPASYRHVCHVHSTDSSVCNHINTLRLPMSPPTAEATIPSLN